MLLCLEGDSFSQSQRVRSSLCHSFPFPEPSSRCLHLSQPIQHNQKGSPKTARHRKPSSLQFICQLFGEDYYMFFPRVFFPFPKEWLEFHSA